MWLNSRLGEHVSVSLMADRGGHSVCVVEAQGELRHWRQGRPVPSGIGRAELEDMMGLYAVGDGGLDVTELAGPIVSGGFGDGLTWELADGVQLMIVHATLGDLDPPLPPRDADRL